MKKVEAFIRHEAFEPIRTDLLNLGFPSLSISEVKGSGRQKGITERYRGAQLTNWLRPKVKLECVVATRDVETVVETILKHARTGSIGDGKVFVMPVEEAYRIRTGESGEETLQAHKAAAAAAAAETSPRTCGKWVSRYRTSSESGLLDRSSAPRSVANRTDERRIEAIAALRRLRFTGPEIAELLGMALSTVSGILTRIGMGRLGRLGMEPAERYERERPGELIHVDVKKLGRIERGAGKRVFGGLR